MVKREDIAPGSWLHDLQLRVISQAHRGRAVRGVYRRRGSVYVGVRATAACTLAVTSANP